MCVRLQIRSRSRWFADRALARAESIPLLLNLWFGTRPCNLCWPFNATAKGSSMRKLVLLSAVTLCLGAVGAGGAQAQGYGYRDGYGYGRGYDRGYDRGYGRHRDYGYRRHRGLSTGAAVGLGIAGAAAGAAAAGAFDRGGPGYYGRGY
jgi:hypothetical protein